MDSRWDVVEAYPSAAAGNARKSLDTLLQRAPFAVGTIQVDGGSEFMAEFEQACAEKNSRLFVLPPQSPKLMGIWNGHKEPTRKRTTNLYMGELDLKSVNQVLYEWEGFYDTARPHHSLDLRTPAEYLGECHSGLAST